MKEAILRDFFTGQVNAAELAVDLVGGIVAGAPGEWTHPIEDMAGTFAVEPSHLVRVCDAVLTGQLEPACLEAIGFCLGSSDAFCWDGDAGDGARVAEVAYAWSAPEVNLPLTMANAERWRAYLIEGHARP